MIINTVSVTVKLVTLWTRSLYIGLRVRLCMAVTQAARVVYAFSHHPDKLRALEMMEPVCLLLSTVAHQTVCATSQTCAPVLRVLDFLSIW